MTSLSDVLMADDRHDDFYNLFFYFLLSHYTYNTLQIYLAGQRQLLPISIIKHCHTVYIQIHYLLVLQSLLV